LAAGYIVVAEDSVIVAMNKMICAFVFLFIHLTESILPRPPVLTWGVIDDLFIDPSTNTISNDLHKLMTFKTELRNEQVLFVDIHVDPTRRHLFFQQTASTVEQQKEDNKYHDSGCTFYFWQKDTIRKIRYVAVEKGMKSPKMVDLTNPIAENAPLYMSTTCHDALWVDHFVMLGKQPSLELPMFNSNTENIQVNTVRYYGGNDKTGWCVSTDRDDWTWFNSVDSTCYHTLELSPHNTICEGCQGIVKGHHRSKEQIGSGRRILDDEPKKANNFAAVLEEYFHCVQTLGDDDQACESLSIAALEIFDQDDVVIVSGGSDADESETVDAEPNVRRKL